MRLLTKICVFTLILSCLYFPQVKYVSHSPTPPKPVYASQTIEKPVVVEVVKEWTKEDTMRVIDLKAWQYDVDATLLKRIIECESGGDMASTTIQSRHYKDGIREQSFGLVQIHLPSNPDMTYEQAIDPNFSIDYLAKQLSKGRGYLWTCYRMLK